MTADLIATMIAQRESEVSERSVTLAKLHAAHGRVSENLAGLTAMRAGSIEDVPSDQLDTYLETMKTIDSDVASLRRVKKELERRISHESSAHSMAARDLARKRSQVAAMEHKAGVLAGLRAALAPLDDLAQDRAVHNGPNGVVSDLIGLRGRVQASIALVEKHW